VEATHTQRGRERPPRFRKVYAKAKKLVRVVPDLEQVADWVEQDKNLPRAVSY
jgi:hypothetical protein